MYSKSKTVFNCHNFERNRMNMTHVLTLFCASVCLLQTGLVQAEIVLAGTAGHNAELTCLTKPNTSVSWQYRRERTDPEQYICIDGNVLLSWRHKYVLTAVNPGSFVLTVNNVSFNESGIYSCIEDGGIGDKNSVRLKVVPEVETTQPTQPTPCINDEPTESSCSTSTALSVAIIILIICMLIVLIAFFVHFERRGKFATYELVPHAEKGKTSSERMKLLSAEAAGDKASRRVINKDTWVSGVTIVRDKIYLLRGKLLQVYNSVTHDRLESHTIDILYRHYRNDMTSCSDNHCLYISDYFHKNILRISLPNISEKVTTTWKLECRPSGLSVTGSHTLLVTSFDACRLLELNTDGTTVREIKLPSDLDWPMHAIQLGSGNYVVCHGGDGVWLVDANGGIKESYDGDKARSEGPLAWPCHVAVRKDGSILVADHYNDRIVQLNANLRYVSEAVDRHQLQRPRRLHLINDKERLYVGQWNGELTYFDLH